MYFSDPLTIVLSNPGVSRLSEAQIARISPVGIGHANEAEAGVPYYDDIFDEDDECTTADISDPDGSIVLGLGGMYYEEGMHYTAASERQKRVDCFRAAEILYRHAAGRGNAIGWLCAWGTCTRTTAARVGTSARITTISAKFHPNRIRTFWHTSAFVMRPKRGSRRAATSWETCWPRAEAVRLIMRRRSTCSCGRTCVTDIAAGTFYTRYMIEEDDTMDEVVKADSSAGKT